MMLGLASIEVDVELSDGDWTADCADGGEKSFDDGESIPESASASFSNIVGSSEIAPEIELCRLTNLFSSR